LGELSLLDQEPRSATAIALEKTILYQFKRKVLIEFLKKYPMAALEFLRFFAERIRRTDDLLRYSTTENPNIIADSKMSLLDRISAKIGQRIITVGFVVANIILFSAWIIFNVISIEFFPHFDPYPFSFLSAISTIEAFFITCLVLISQNILSRKEKIRNDVEYEVNLKTQFEIERLSKKIDKLLAEKKDANK
jgi:CRP/FNR family cyclic AMP-dependent transcriptional regulator